MKKVIIYTDGACRGNPGPGGWAVTLEFGEHRRELSDGDPETTNNRMELRAAVEALSALAEPCQIELYTDSEYLKNGMASWLPRWKENGWKTASRSPVKNEDLWHKLDSLSSKHKIEWRWVKGHAGDVNNERCDRLANAAIDKLIKRAGG